MDFRKILEELILIADRANAISTRMSDDYPLIPSNIVATKKAESLEKDVISLRASNKILQLENNKLHESIENIYNEIESLSFIGSKNSALDSNHDSNINSQQIAEASSDAITEDCIIQNNSPEESK